MLNIFQIFENKNIVNTKCLYLLLIFKSLQIFKNQIIN